MKTNQLVLQKDSSVTAIRSYFEFVSSINDQGSTQFPIDLDTVWPLAYLRKDHAVRALTVSDFFTEGVDYEKIPKNGEREGGFKVNEKYYLTIPAFEWFIAKRVPAVFEVYRQVFHAVRKQAAALPIINQELVEKVGYPVLIDGRLFYSYRRVLRAAGYTARLTRFYKKATAECVTPQLFGDGGASHYRYANGEWLCSDRVYVARRREKMAWNRFIAERQTSISL